MKQIIGLLSIIVLVAFGNTTTFAQGQAQWVLKKKAKKEAYKTEKKNEKDYDYYKQMSKEEINAHKAARQKRMQRYQEYKRTQGNEVRSRREKTNYQGSNSRGEYKGERRGRCGTGNHHRRMDRKGGDDGKRIDNRRGNTTTPRTKPDNERVVVRPQPTTKPSTSTKPRVVVRPTTTPTSTKPRVIVKSKPTKTPSTSTNGGLKSRRSSN